jgi:hypothetical protein
MKKKPKLIRRVRQYKGRRTRIGKMLEASEFARRTLDRYKGDFKAAYRAVVASMHRSPMIMRQFACAGARAELLKALQMHADSVRHNGSPEAGSDVVDFVDAKTGEVVITEYMPRGRLPFAGPNRVLNANAKTPATQQEITRAYRPWFSVAIPYTHILLGKATFGQVYDTIERTDVQVEALQRSRNLRALIVKRFRPEEDGENALVSDYCTEADIEPLADEVGYPPAVPPSL